MSVFVINEWLWHDSSGANGPVKQKEAFQALVELAKSIHRIVVLEGSPFEQKAWSLCRSPDQMVCRLVGRIYIRAMRLDPDRCVVLRPADVATLPDDLARSTKPDDHYLLQCLLHVKGAILVTTDGDLRQAVIKAGKPCLSREVFLTEHLCLTPPSGFDPTKV